MGTDTVFGVWQSKQRDRHDIAPGYGDGHDVRYRNCPIGRLGGPSRLRRRDMGTDTMSDMPIRNIQRETFNSQLLTG